jgi:hypothetical protein
VLFEPKQVFPFSYGLAVKLMPLPIPLARSFSPRFQYLYFSIFIFPAVLPALFSPIFSSPVIFQAIHATSDHGYLS